MKINKLLIAVFCTVILAVGCKKEEHDEARPIDVTVQLTVDEDEVWFAVPYEEANIKLVSKNNNKVYEVKADATGKINLEKVVPGIYDINVSLVIKAEQYTALVGVYRENDFTLNYSLTGQRLYQDEQKTIKLIATETVRGFVIKQVYYAGSHKKDAAINRDNFIEIYNNSDETLYADSLMLVLAYGKVSTKTDAFSLPNNQFDWSKSIGMNVSGDANEDYIYAKGIFMIPSDGTGKKYPVLPGKSIVLAGTAINHKAQYKNSAGGTTAGPDKPELTVDLSNADFEVWLYPYEQKVQPGRSPFPNDVDNLNVPNAEVFFATSMRDMYFAPQARESFVLMKVDNSFNLHDIVAFPSPLDRNITNTTTKYPQLSTKYIIDAVEVEEPLASDRSPRRLPQRYDAGAVSVPGGEYSSQSVVRKTLKTVNGRRILKDTNNSSSDFGYLNRANPYKGNDSFLD